MSSGDSVPAPKIKLAVLAVLLLVYGLTTLTSRWMHVTPVRQNSGGGCPSPVLSFTAPATDESGLVFNSTFAAKRKFGAWHATIELGTMQSSETFIAAGPKFVVEGCTWYSPWIRKRYVDLVDAGGQLLASIDSDPFSFGWSIKINDCAGELLYTIEEKKGLIKAADLTVADASGRSVATSSYDWEFFGTNTLTLTSAAAAGEGRVLARATTPSMFFGTAQWQLFAQRADDGAAVPMVDPLVLAAVAGYKTWSDKSCGKNCRGDFNGVCEASIQLGEVLLVAALLGAAYHCARADWSGCVGAFGRLCGGSGDGGSGVGRTRPGCTRRPSIDFDNPMHTPRRARRPLGGEVAAAAAAQQAAAAMFEVPVGALPAGSPLPPTVSHESV